MSEVIKQTSTDQEPISDLLLELGWSPQMIVAALAEIEVNAVIMGGHDNEHKAAANNLVIDSLNSLKRKGALD